MGGAGDGAADEGVETLDAVHEPVPEQEIKGPIDRRRCRPGPLGAQRVENFVSPHRPVPAPHQFQHPPPERRQSHAVAPAHRLGPVQCLLDAGPVIVPGAGKAVSVAHGVIRGLHHCYDIT